MSVIMPMLSIIGVLMSGSSESHSGPVARTSDVIFSGYTYCADSKSAVLHSPNVQLSAMHQDVGHSAQPDRI